MHKKATYTKANQLRYDSFSQKYQGTSGQVLNAFDDIFSPLYGFSLSPACRVSPKTHFQRANYQAFISVSECAKLCMANKLES